MFKKIKKLKYMWDYHKTFQYVYANRLTLCLDCNIYFRNYQVELKEIHSNEYRELNHNDEGIFQKNLHCIRCLGTNLDNVRHLNVGLRKHWMDHYGKAPKLTLSEFADYKLTVERHEEIGYMEEEIKLFIEVNGFKNIKIHHPEEFKKEAKRIDSLFE